MGTHKKTTGEVKIHPGQINTVIYPETGKYQEYGHIMKEPDKTKCTKEIADEIGCIFQGIRYIKGTDTCFFVHRHKFIQDRNVIYSCIVCNIRPQKKENHIV